MYMKISDYGAIGNCRSSALVSVRGSIDWACLPDFDSSSVFGRLLDDEKGGYFSITPDRECAYSQQYVGNTNILKTTVSCESYSFEIIDFMTIYRTDGDQSYYNAPEIYRMVRVLRGVPVIKADYHPMLDYARPTRGKIEARHIKHSTTEGRYESIYLYTDADKKRVLEGEPFHVEDRTFFCVSYNQKLVEQDFGRVYLEYQRTKTYWLNWSNRTIRYKLYNDKIIRSALLLKMLTYERTGAVVAAPTTSLPETIGESRNWDYRFCWIRDSSMVIKTFLQLGHKNSARIFQRFILNVNRGKNEDIQIMYGLRGERDLEEAVLDQLKGYMNSPPVRIGNGAYRQKQHDIYGTLTDLIYISLQKFPSTLDISEELWTLVRSLVAVVARQWKLPDKGIWEIRGVERHFVYSKMMSWVAVDRGVKIADMLGRRSYVEEWEGLAVEIAGDIMRNGWSEKVGAFVQHYGSDSLDASNLLMEEMGFIEADDPKYVSTVLRTREQLCRNGHMFRYINEDDFGIPRSSFVLCSFWLVNALVRIGRREDAEIIFENVTAAVNHVGLLSEHIDVENGDLLGNFPQAYSHLGMIQSALLLNGEDEHFQNNIFRFVKP